MSGADMSRETLLEIRDLNVSFGHDRQKTEAVRNVSFDIAAGGIVGIVGESGSGKSVTCRAILGLLPASASVGGSISLRGRELLSLDEETLRDIRGRQISMIFQNPSSHLDPLMTIGRQVGEPLIHHREMTGKEVQVAAIQCLRDVKLDRPEQRAQNYPHQLSGGMKQRAMIASAIACQPQLLLADEPTTALDVTVQAHILGLLKEINQEKKLSIVLVSHDLAVIAQVCDRVIVMRDGLVVEQGRTTDIIKSPQHDYTRKLIASQPGHSNDGQSVPRDNEGRQQSSDPHLQIEDLCVEFDLPRKGFRRPSESLKALDKISVDLHRGRALGIVGESGSGKSTLAKVIMGLVKPVSGDVKLNGTSILKGVESGAQNFRMKVQMAFQNPFDSLNPRFSVYKTIAEPLEMHEMVARERISDRVSELMDLVELDQSLCDRKPMQLSGGQCQRVGIARALAMNPEILIADEITSALDVTIQAQIMLLLKRLQEKVGLSVIFISHDLALVRSFCDQVAVFQSGRVVEKGATEQVLQTPSSNYTRTLLDSAPSLWPEL
jgi:peptide/nickel transport system ATP-binding protein